jgi:predicted outer membrane repeat protein
MTSIRFCALLALSLCMHAAAATLNVPSAQYPTIQSAINAAANGDVVLVGPGPYTERIDLKGKAIHLKASAGRSSTFISSGGVAGAIVSCITGETANCVIEGFTIYGANGTGIAITSASPVFKLCAINQNDNSGSNGGGVAFTGSSGSPRFEDCQFVGNSAVGREGGAMALSATNGTVTCVRCAFSSNDATGSFGGAIYATTTAVTLTDCSFLSNAVTASLGDRQGGAIYATGSLTAQGCTFSSNGVTVGGGSCGTGDKHARGGAISSSGTMTLTDCAFSENKAEAPDGVNGCCCNGNSVGRAWGGALYGFGTLPVKVTNCTFVSNTAIINGGGAPRESRGGAVAVQNGCDPDFTNCTFTGNSAVNTGYGAGGTLWYDGGSLGIMQDCTISGSSTLTEGGAIFLNGGAKPTILRTTISNCSTTGSGSNGGALRAQDEANPFMSQCRFTNCSSPNGGAIYTRNANPFIIGCAFDANTSASGSAVKTEGSGNPNVPTIQSSFFCGNSGLSTNWIAGNWNNPTPASNSLAASCGSDCNLNGILDAAEIAAGLATDCDANAQPDDCQADCDGDGSIDSCEIAGGAADCNTNGVPDSCEIAKGADDINNDGVLDSCEPVDFIGLRSEIVPIVNRSDDSSSDALPATAVCYRLYAEFNGPGAAVWGIFGNEEHPMVIANAAGFHNSGVAGDLTVDVPCSDASSPASLRYDSWLTLGSTCLSANALQGLGFPKGLFLNSGLVDDDCGVVVTPGSPQGIAGPAQRVLIAQLTTTDGNLPTGSISLVGRNIDGSDLLAYGQSWPAPALVDCNGNGNHDAYDIRDGVATDCDESGVPDVCEYPNPNEDCNDNGSPDLCDIRTGASADVNANTVPDECECEGDVDGDGTVNIDDVIEVILAWGDLGPNPADLNGNGIVDGSDFAIVLSAYGSCQ